MNNNTDIFRDNLWTLASEIIRDNDSFKASVRFNTLHRIFEVHFPGSPIVPGACIIQIATELLALHLSRPVILYEAKNIKFINLINPLQNNVVEFIFKVTSHDDGKTGAAITVSDGGKIFVKISAQFREL